MDRWLKRNNVKCATLCGESGDVPQDVVDDWAKRLPTPTEGYALETYLMQMRLVFIIVLC